ncbi:MAG: hypothetical protein JWQ71_1277 [Pedosphaera sp.]|nr:hypothetical protein [Pedosphaera sp.]
MKSALIIILVAALGGVAYAIQQRVTRQARERLLAELATLPPVTLDFTTPEGAILCLEDAYRKHDIEAAVACRDFATEARLWLQQRPFYSSDLLAEMLSEMTKTMEWSYRESMATHWPIDWERAQSYFSKREPYAEGVVVVCEVTRGPDGSLLRQRLLVTETPTGWRVVTHLPK